ncbi:MAG: TIM barrel protein [Candidatus Woesearchaeota archaeon]
MIRIGPAGLGSDPISALKLYASLGFKAAEVEFVHGVRFDSSKAKLIGKEARALDISLSIHAPYYINLASPNRAIRAASKRQILDCCERGHWLGSVREPVNIVFHPAFYGKLEHEECYEIVKEELEEVLEVVHSQGWNVQLAPETTGKFSQFGSLEELVRLANELGCSLCVDFCHLKARGQGKINYGNVIETVLKVRGLKRLACHLSGVEWTSKGERRHLLTTDEEIIGALSAIARARIDANIINESPDTIRDCIRMVKVLRELETTQKSK